MSLTAEKFPLSPAFNKIIILPTHPHTNTNTRYKHAHKHTKRKIFDIRLSSFIFGGSERGRERSRKEDRETERVRKRTKDIHRERERQRERDQERKTERERDRERYGKERKNIGKTLNLSYKQFVALIGSPVRAKFCFV